MDTKSISCVLLVLFATCELLESAVSPPISPSLDYEHSVVMNEDETYFLYWVYDKESITFEIIANTSGYVGLGFSPNGNMLGSDIVIGWMDSRGEPQLQDRFVKEGRSKPIVDESQDVTLLRMEWMNGYLAMKFKRFLRPCDKSSDRYIREGTVRVIWATGDLNMARDDIIYHGPFRGVRQLYLIEHGSRRTDLPPDTSTYNILMDKHQIPSVSTHYGCILAVMPQLPRKHHLIKFESSIEEGNEGLVHHILLHRCDVEHFTQELVGKPCGDTFYLCMTNPILGWAVGGQPVFYPENAGYPIPANQSELFALEIHYDNPEMKSGLTDSSGLRIYYTPTLRKYDAGTLAIGSMTDYSITIPPGTDEFIHFAYCVDTCLGKAIESTTERELTIEGVFLHSHIAGRKMRLRHITNKKELAPIMIDDSYDFDYQSFHTLKEPRKFKPNDSFQLECVYSTVGR